MKPRIRKAAGTGWWCDNGDITGLGATPLLAYASWLRWGDYIAQIVLEDQDPITPSSPKEDNQDQTRRE